MSEIDQTLMLPRTGEASRRGPLHGQTEKDTEIRDAPISSSADDSADDTPSPVRTLSGGKPTVKGYEILGELGRGNMGVVYKARQEGLNRLVALKMIRAGGHALWEEEKRFLEEARVVARLQHPHIVQIYDIGHQEELPYFSMEFVEGGTLAEKLAGRPQPARQAAQLIELLAQAIQVAHENNIVHRDLKPANILLTPEGQPKITDFGLAKQLGSNAGWTESGMIMGTPSYMAPEQAEGKSREVGPAADIYALGAILYELLTGRPPYNAESPMETVLQIFRAEPVPPTSLQPKISRDLETICLTCLQKEPRKRYASALALADDLKHFLTGEPIAARSPSRREKVWKWARRHPALATLAASCAAALLCLAGLALWHQVDLHAQLDQALADEREAREAQESANARERQSDLRDQIKDLLRAGETALALRDWQTAQLQFTRARDRAGKEEELADLRARADQFLDQVNHQAADRERYRKFVQRRDDALFYATLFTGMDLAANLDQTRKAAQEALALVDEKDGSRWSFAESPYMQEQEKAEVLAGCYELLLVLADAVAQPIPGRPTDERSHQANQAIGFLDRAAQLGISTRAYHLRRAHYLAQAGDDSAAARERTQAEARQPTTAMDHFLVGQEHYREGDNSQAIGDFQKALQLQPDHFWSQYFLALSWLKTRRPDLAATTLTACLGRRSDFVWLYLLRGSAWAELGQFTSAEADFQKALERPLNDTARYGLHVNRAVLRLRQNQLPEAQADLQAAIALKPQQYQAFVNLAQVYQLQQNLDEAIRQLDQAIQRESRLASLYRTRARLHLQRQDLTRAFDDFGKAIELESKRLSADLADDFLERGRILFQRKELKAAVENYDAAMLIRPRHPLTHRLRAAALVELDRFAEALPSLDACLKFGPPEAEVFRARATVKARLGQYTGAQADFSRALEFQADAETFTARGWTYVVADAPRLALPDFEEALRLDPNFGDAYLGRGFVQASQGQIGQAVADAEEGLRRGKPSARLYYNAARIYAQAVGQLDRNLTNQANRRDLELRANYQDRALHLLQQALGSLPESQRLTFWKSYLQSDAALNPIRRSPGFVQLAAPYSRAIP